MDVWSDCVQTTYEVRLEDERIVRRHVDHVQGRTSSSDEPSQTEEEMLDDIDIPSPPARGTKPRRATLTSRDDHQRS